MNSTAINEKINEMLDLYAPNNTITENDLGLESEKDVLNHIISTIKMEHPSVEINYFFIDKSTSVAYDVAYYSIVFYVEGIHHIPVIFEYY